LKVVTQCEARQYADPDESEQISEGVAASGTATDWGDDN
jgi:hypothetical protein